MSYLFCADLTGIFIFHPKIFMVILPLGRPDVTLYVTTTLFIAIFNAFVLHHRHQFYIVLTI